MSDTAKPYPAPGCPAPPDTAAQGYLTAAELATAARINAQVAERLRAVVIALIEEYAPRAPQAIKNEAAIRFAGYISQAPSGSIQKLDLKGIAVEFRQAPPASAFQLCGAKALLTRWKVRRGGAIG